VSKKKPAPKLMSLREFARRRGVSPEAVSKAIKKLTLKESVVRDAAGVPKIRDPDLADREWDANTDPSKAPGYVKERVSARARAAAGSPPRTNPAGAGDNAGGEGDLEEPDNLSLAEESAREKFWRAQLAELDYRKKVGELVLAKDVESRMADDYANCKRKLLGISSRARQQDPGLTRAQIALIEALVREALEDLGGDEGGAAAGANAA
jgi:hypothetical protein